MRKLGVTLAVAALLGTAGCGNATAPDPVREPGEARYDGGVNGMGGGKADGGTMGSGYSAGGTVTDSTTTLGGVNGMGGG